MRYFIADNNVIRAIDADQNDLIQNNWKEITESEAQEILKPTKEQERQWRIAELKALLHASDYKVLPDYDKPNADIKQKRQAWRNELRQLGG